MFLKSKITVSTVLASNDFPEKEIFEQNFKTPNGNYTINNNYNIKKEEGKEKGKSEGIPNCHCFFSCLILIITL